MRKPIPVLKHLQDRRGADPSLLERGFTLVELLVVIVILGILAAVVVFAVGGSTSDAKNSACKADRATAETAVEDAMALRSMQGICTSPPTGSHVSPR